MSKIKIFRRTFLICFMLGFSLSMAQDCDRYITKMDSLLKLGGGTYEANRMMKFYYTCIGETTDKNNPVLQRLSKIRWLKPFNNGYSIAHIDDKQYIIDREFNAIKKLKYIGYTGFSEGLSAALVKTYYYEKNNKYSRDLYGFVNVEDEIVIPAQFKYIRSEFYKGIAIVENINSEVAAIDTKGNIVIPYHKASSCGDCWTVNYFIFYEGNYKKAIYIVHKDGEKYEIPKEVDKVFYNNSENFEKKEIVPIIKKVKDENLFGAINNKAVVTIPPKFRRIDIKKDIAIVQDPSTNLHGVYNAEGHVLIPLQYKSIYFGFGMSNLLIIDDRYVSVNNSIVNFLEFDYNQNEYFKNDLLRVKKDGKYGFINLKGELSIPLQFDDALPFENGKTRVRKEDKVFTINTNGDCIQDCL